MRKGARVDQEGLSWLGEVQQGLVIGEKRGKGTKIPKCEGPVPSWALTCGMCASAVTVTDNAVRLSVA